MTDAPRNRNQLTWIKLDRAALKVDGKPPFKHQKRLIRVWMKVPMVWLYHRRNPNDMIIDLCNRMIVVSQMRRRLCRQRDDLWKLSIHRQTSRPTLVLLSTP